MNRETRLIPTNTRLREGKVRGRAFELGNLGDRFERSEFFYRSALERTDRRQIKIFVAQF